MEFEVKTARTSYVKIRQAQLLKLYDALAFHRETSPDTTGIAACVVMFTRRGWIWYKLQEQDWIKPFLIFRRDDSQSNFSPEDAGPSNFPASRPPVVTNTRRLKAAIEVAALQERLKVKDQELDAVKQENKRLEEEVKRLKLQVQVPGREWNRIMESPDQLPSPVREDVLRLREDLKLLAQGDPSLRAFRDLQ